MRNSLQLALSIFDQKLSFCFGLQIWHFDGPLSGVFTKLIGSAGLTAPVELVTLKQVTGLPQTQGSCKSSLINYKVSSDQELNFMTN